MMIDGNFLMAIDSRKGGRHSTVTFCVGIKLLLPWTLLLWKLSRDELNAFPALEKLTDQLR